MSDPSTRPLALATAVELATLTALLVDLATVHWAPLASAVGPLHGTAYLVTAVLAWHLPVPDPYGAAACRAARSTSRPPTAGTSPRSRTPRGTGSCQARTAVTR